MESKNHQVKKIKVKISGYKKSMKRLRRMRREFKELRDLMEEISELKKALYKDSIRR